MSEEKAVNIAIKDITADYKWNSRTIDPAVLAKSEGWAAFKNSFLDDKGAIRQEMPVVVRGIKGKQNKYQLVQGFRRYLAISELGGTHIKAFVRDMSDSDARSSNVRENTARDDLSIADRVWGLGQLLEQRKASGAPDVKITDDAIAKETGMSQGYVNRCLRTYGNGKSESPGLDDKVMAAWRAQEDPIPLARMLIIADSVPKAEQMKAFLKEVEARAGKPKGKGGRGSWIKTVVKQATTLGEGIGTLEASGILKVDMKAIKGFDFSTLFDKIPENATAKDRRAIGEALGTAYQRALEGYGAEADEEESDDDDSGL